MSNLFNYSNKWIIYVLIVFLFFLLRIYILQIFYYNPFNQDQILFFALIERSIEIPNWLIIGFGFCNLIFLILIGKILWSDYAAYLPAFLYTISPWSVYLEVFGSAYIYLLMWVLLGLYGVIRFSQLKDKLGLVCTLLACTALLYSSLLMWVVVLTFLILLFKLSKLFSSSLQYLVTIGFFLILLPWAIIFYNLNGVKNIFIQQFTIFADPGLINTVNKFQGESRESGFGVTSRIFENKYQYLLKHGLLNILEHFAPATYFTPQEKLLGFSFNPPIFLGWLIPFFYGVYTFLKQIKMKRYWLAGLVLLIPSILSQHSPDLQRLLLFSPLVFLIISQGLADLSKSTKEFKYKVLQTLVAILIIVQIGVSLFDTSMREQMRLKIYFPEQPVNNNLTNG